MNLLEYEPIKKFIDTLGKDIEKYFGKDEACIIYLRPDGIFYAEGLYEWLSKKKKDVTISAMEDDGNGLEEEKVRGRKVLLVDNDVVTGKGYKRSMDALRTRKAELGIRDIKFATFSDRVGLADFAVGKYSAEAIWHLEELDAIDLKIITLLAKDGRASYAEIGVKVRLSSVTVKNRIERLSKEKIVKVQGALNIHQFYTMSAQVEIEADEKTVGELIEKLEKMQEVYHLVRTISGQYNLVVGILAHNLQNLEELVEHELRTMPGVKRLNVFIGELPVSPKTFPPKI